jgi:hypothetical protein
VARAVTEPGDATGAEVLVQVHRELRAMAVQEPQQVRADAALLRALVGTDAALVLVDPGTVELDGGVGALLRYADESTSKHSTGRSGTVVGDSR